MGFQILSNIPSLTALGNLNKLTHSTSQSLAKLSTGLRIVTAGDDPSGLMISERMRAQIGSLTTDKLNASEGVTMLSTAEGALNEVSDILGKVRSLATRASQDITLGTNELQALDDEKASLIEEVDRIAAYVQFNGKTLFDGTLSGALQVGPSATANDEILVTISAMDSSTLTIDGIDLTSSVNARASLVTIDAAIQAVSQIRGDLGSAQSRLYHTMNNLDLMVQNTTAAQSNIRDVDMASEISNFTKLQILQQSAVSMLGQANAQPQAVLSLLK